jgi:hypothetical protein
VSVSSDVEAEIRRLHDVEGWPPGTIARQLVLHIDVVRRVLGVAVAAPLMPRRSIVDEYTPFIVENLRHGERARLPGLTANDSRACRSTSPP